MKNTIYAILLGLVALVGFSGCSSISPTVAPDAPAADMAEAQQLMDIAKQCHGKVKLKLGTVRGQTQGGLTCAWEELVIK
jgi:uncharacterized protein YceK